MRSASLHSQVRVVVNRIGKRYQTWMEVEGAEMGLEGEETGEGGSRESKKHALYEHITLATPVTTLLVNGCAYISCWAPSSMFEDSCIRLYSCSLL